MNVNINAIENLLKFFDEYLEFFLTMLSTEKAKLSALTSNNLSAIEHYITVKQAENMKLDSLERKREMLMNKTGYDGMSFSQVIALVPDDYKENFRVVFMKLNSTITDIKELNNKSMDTVKMNMKFLQPNSPIQAKGYYKQPESYSSVLQTKI